MTKRTHLTLLYINLFFVFGNGVFMYFSALPLVNLFAGLFCLLAAAIAYYNWANANE